MRGSRSVEGLGQSGGGSGAKNSLVGGGESRNSSTSGLG